MSTIAIHQPNYYPWLGYFFKIRQSDLFVFLDDVEFSKRSVTRRVRIRRQKGDVATSYLTVPLKKQRDTALINELIIDHQQPWQKKQEHQVFNVYSKAPFFSEIFPVFQHWLKVSREFRFLSPYNQYIIQEIADMLWGGMDFRLSSQCVKSTSVDDINLQLLIPLKGKVYLSGQGGKSYQSEEAFARAGIRIQYNNCYELLAQNPYPQQQGSWLNGLSIIDALMNLGNSGVREILEELARSSDII